MDIVQGTTASIDFQLTDNGAAVNLTGGTVVLILKDAYGVAVDTSGDDVSVLDADEGMLRVRLDTLDLDVSKSPYYARWKVTLAGADAFYPQGAADVWTVHPQ